VPPIDASVESTSSSTTGGDGAAAGALAILGWSIGGRVPARRHDGQTKSCDAELYTMLATSTTLPHAGQRFCLRIAMSTARGLHPQPVINVDAETRARPFVA
jgi:hypothetical protein